MKVASSLKTLKSRDRNCQVVRRRGRLYVINKRNPRMKARQGLTRPANHDQRSASPAVFHFSLCFSNCLRSTVRQITFQMALTDRSDYMYNGSYKQNGDGPRPC